MPTLQDVAKRAGVSTATVSKVLSNTPYFTDETRDKVMRAVKELGYVPNLAARALATGKTHIIAAVFPYIYDPIFKDPLVMNILEGVEAECTPRGYNLLLSTPQLSTNGDLDSHYKQLVQSGYIDGVITIDNVPLASALPLVNETGIPAVATGYHEAEYYVYSDDYRGGMLLIQHLLELGHQKIGIITVPETANLAVNRRIDAIKTVAADAGLDFDAIPIDYGGNYSIESGAKAASNLLQKHPELTALLCLNDRMAIGAIQQARRMERSIPDDLTVVGYDDIPTAALFTPSLTTINQHALKVGHAAARMLFDILDGKSPDPMVWPVELIVRDSSAAPR